ncbi:MAG: hypothetical protein ACRYG8_40625 [Janthinobacterium lividum]
MPATRPPPAQPMARALTEPFLPSDDLQHENTPADPFERLDLAYPLRLAPPGAVGLDVQAALQEVGGLSQPAAAMRQDVLAPILTTMWRA